MIRANKGCGMSNTIMNWNELKSTAQLDQIREESKTTPVLIFKYSNRCSVSQLALDRFERNGAMKKPVVSSLLSGSHFIPGSL